MGACYFFSHANKPTNQHPIPGTTAIANTFTCRKFESYYCLLTSIKAVTAYCNEHQQPRLGILGSSSESPMLRCLSWGFWLLPSLSLLSQLLLKRAVLMILV